MTAGLAYTLAAAAVGVVAAFWFCIGTAFMPAEQIAELSRSYWDYSKAHADAVIAQSAQYSVGALLLVVTFVLQVAAALAPSATNVPLPTALTSPYAFLVAIVVPTWLLSFFLYKLIQRVKGPRVHAILKKGTEQQ